MNIYIGAVFHLYWFQITKKYCINYFKLSSSLSFNIFISLYTVFDFLYNLKYIFFSYFLYLNLFIMFSCLKCFSYSLLMSPFFDIFSQINSCCIFVSSAYKYNSAFLLQLPNFCFFGNS